ncbi:hypothetical protein PVAP13_4KG280910 [Panicum virgatum]|uniref:Uncharacterized protein n=1 Tax=Panicum virgatum TaxID=38727 RepID=A0A8T0TWW1_PANVG|nr:hypothetical protein PVAP13_4KG280910 [Panicum virgatum]
MAAGPRPRRPRGDGHGGQREANQAARRVHRRAVEAVEERREAGGRGPARRAHHPRGRRGQAGAHHQGGQSSGAGHHAGGHGQPVERGGVGPGRDGERAGEAVEEIDSVVGRDRLVQESTSRGSGTSRPASARRSASTPSRRSTCPTSCSPTPLSPATTSPRAATSSSAASASAATLYIKVEESLTS